MGTGRVMTFCHDRLWHQESSVAEMGVAEEIVNGEDLLINNLDKSFDSGLSLGDAECSGEAVECALEQSGELESSGELEGSTGDGLPPRVCAICLCEMQRRPRGPGQPLVPACLGVATLECGHKFHRRCLLSWCRERPPGGCPMCRKSIQLRKRIQ